MISRRAFLSGGALLAAGCRPVDWLVPAPTVLRPGMVEGHRLRDGAPLPQVRNERRVKVAVIGSGASGLTAAWKLAREGLRDFVVVSGPETFGNAAGGRFGERAYPRGAHYLPLPSPESRHVRTLLADLGILERDTYDARPTFDERAVVHAPDERVLVGHRWQEGLVPDLSVSHRAPPNVVRFFDHVAQLQQARGSDGRRAFAVPLELSSADPRFTDLDRTSFRDWLSGNGYSDPALDWYLDYCCRDDYGSDAGQISAWAGLHYFASRGGHARNAADGAVLTWPDGLAAVMARLASWIDQRLESARTWMLPGTAVHIRERNDGVEVLYVPAGAEGSAWRIHAEAVVCAVPLHVAAHIVEGIGHYGYDAAAHAPLSAPWLVANVLLEGFPEERDGTGLAWDNVVYGGRGLGYVVSTHQDIRSARPTHTVFTAYNALGTRDVRATRARLEKASGETLFELAACDLLAAYGNDLRLRARAVEVTVRGHAMASPSPGFLHNPGLRSLRAVDGRLLFAHSDLSGLSVFEEAAWWGERAAERALARIG